MRILILVQSIDLPNKSGYKRLQKAQEETWDSVHHPDVDVIYYYPGSRIDDVLEGNKLHIVCDTHWKHMFFNLAKAMRHMLKHDMSWDYIFKTDNSTYVDKAKLYETLLTKPREKYYGGMDFTFRSPEMHKAPFFWGDGYALSRDMVAYIVGKYNAAPLRGNQEDDIVIGLLLADVAKWDPTLTISLPILNNNEVEPGYCTYRSRIDAINCSPAAYNIEDLDKIIDNDIMMMHKIHNTITNGQTNNYSSLQRQS